MAGDGADVDDRAAPGFGHGAADMLGAEERAGEIDAEDMLPFVERGLLDRLVDRVHAGVVDQDVDPAEPRECGVAQGDHVGLDGDIAGVGEGLGTEFGGGGFERGGGAAGQDEGARRARRARVRWPGRGRVRHR